MGAHVCLVECRPRLWLQQPEGDVSLCRCARLLKHTIRISGVVNSCIHAHTLALQISICMSSCSSEQLCACKNTRRIVDQSCASASARMQRYHIRIVRMIIPITIGLLLQHCMQREDTQLIQKVFRCCACMKTLMNADKLCMLF